MPMLLANFCVHRAKQISTFTHGFVPGMLIVGVISGLIYLQQDLSSAMVVAASGIIILFVLGCGLVICLQPVAPAWRLFWPPFFYRVSYGACLRLV